MFYVISTIRASSASTEMKTYLERKYHEKFSVSDVHKEGSGVGVSGQTVCRGSPVDNSSIVFRVSDTDGRKTDNYIGALWLFRNRDGLEQMIRESSSDIMLDRIDIHIGVDGEIESFHNSLKNKDIRDALKDYPDNIGIAVNIESSREESTKKHQDILRLLAKRLYDFGFRNITISYNFSSTDADSTKMRCVLGSVNIKEGGAVTGLEERCGER